MIEKKFSAVLFMKVSIVFVSAFLLASCQTVATNVTTDDIREVNESQAAPQLNITRYDSALKIFGKMLAAYNADYITVQCKPITDATAAGGVPKNLQQMVITSLNKIGPRIKYLDYDPQYVLTQDALAERMNPNQRAEIVMERPEILISGAITEYDKGLVNKANSLNVDLAGSVTGNQFEAGFGADSDAGTSRIAVDLQIVDFAFAPFALRIELILGHYKDFTLPTTGETWARYATWWAAMKTHPALLSTMPEPETYEARLIEFYLPYSKGGGQEDVTNVA